MIKWQTDADTFEQGQWFKGRVYENKCDLSPDGKLFIYFVFKGSNAQKYPDYGYAWTAISKPPYFIALALWTEYGTWGGGGRFIDNKTVRISVPHDSFHPDHSPLGITVLDSHSEIVVKPEPNKKDQHPQWQLITPGIDNYEEYKQLVESKGSLEPYNDWFQLSDREKGSKRDTWFTQNYTPSILRKQLGDYVLESRHFGYQMHKGDLRKYFMIHNQTGERHLLSDASWADFDQQGRLVLAKEGKLFSGTLQNGDLQLTELADFNANKFEPIEAPAWAQKW
jgi:hypothetical protein